MLKWASDDLKKRGSDSPRLDAELLLGHTLRLNRVELILQHRRPLTEPELSKFKKAFLRRRAREPMAYILGEREFYGLPFRVDSRVLVPRPDSETLVTVALERTHEQHMYGRALDLCTGSGCIALAFAHQRRTWKVLGTDLSEDALVLARQNALRLGLAQSAYFVHGDLFRPLEPGQRFELIMSNPPYIPSGDIPGLMQDVRDFEPHQALDGGPDGCRLLRPLIQGARAHLVPRGLLACEVGAGQSDAVAELFTSAGFVDVRPTRDYGGHERVVSGRLRD